MEAFEASAEVLRALAHPERLRLLWALREGEECVCHLTALLKQRQPYVSQQLGYLRDVGLIADRKEGLRIYYRVLKPQVFELLDALAPLVGNQNPLNVKSTSKARLTGCDCPRCAPQRKVKEAAARRHLKRSGRIARLKSRCV